MEKDSVFKQLQNDFKTLKKFKQKISEIIKNGAFSNTMSYFNSQICAAVNRINILRFFLIIIHNKVAKMIVYSKSYSFINDYKK